MFLKHKSSLCLCILFAAFFLACSANNVNPISSVLGKANDPDPLKIGSKPIPPVQNQAFPKLVVGQIFIDEEKNKQFNIQNPNTLTKEFFESDAQKNKNVKLLQAKPNVPMSDWFSLMSPSGSVLTIWALAQGNWLWGYSLIDSAGFGGARIWRFHFFENNEVMIENGRTGTCVNTYGRGLIHMACKENDKYQRFKLLAMSNGAFTLKSVGTNLCVQAPIGNVFGDFHKVNPINLVNCAAAANLDQQWYIIPPPFLVRPLYDRK